MIEESTLFFRDNFQESSSLSSTTILKIQQSSQQQQIGLVIDPTHSEIQLHDEENYLHLAMSYIDNTLNFQMLSTTKVNGDTSKYLRIDPISMSEDVSQTILSKCSNLLIKQLKMIRYEVAESNLDDIFGDEDGEPVSPKFAQAPPSPKNSFKMQYIATIILDQEIIAVNFTIITTKNKSIFSHSIESMRVKNIKLEGKVNEVFLNREREQIITCIHYPNFIKIQLIDRIFVNPIIKDIAQFPTDSEKIIGSIGVSPEFALIRVVTKNDKDSKKFYLNTYHISHFGIQGTPNDSEITPLKIHLHKKLLSSLVNESNYKVCQTLFSQSLSYLAIYDGSSIEIQDFNNLSAKSIIKEYLPSVKTNNLSQSQSQSHSQNTIQLPLKQQKQMYNLDKSTILISNSSVNQCISMYNLENPISILEQINSFNTESKPIKKIIISQSPQKSNSPFSATNLMEMYSNMKSTANSQLIFVVVILDDQFNTTIPLIVDKDSLDMKVPELKFVSSQITNYYNFDDSQNFFNDFESGFGKSSLKAFDVFKTPDRKASFNLMTSSLENNKYHFSNNNISLQCNNINNNNNINTNNNSQQNTHASITYPSNLRLGKCLNFDNPFANSQRERERSLSQESNSSRNFSAYKPSIYGSNLNNKRTLFNENSNSICEEQLQQIQRTVSSKKDRDNLTSQISNDPSLLDKISPTQQKIEEAINSSDSEEYHPIGKRSKSFRVDTFETSSPLSTQSKNRYRGGITTKGKDISRITMKKQSTSDNIPFILQRTEVSQEDIMDSSSNQNSNGFFTVHSQTQEDIENSFTQEKEQSLLTREGLLRLTAGDSSKNTTAFLNTINTKSRNKSNSIDGDLNKNQIFDCENDDISNIPSQEYMYNQLELEQTISSKKTSQKRNNNIFNNQTSTPTTATCGVKSKQFTGNQKNISSFLGSPAPQSSKASNSNQQKNIFNLKPQTTSNGSSCSSSSSNKSGSSAISDIKPFNMYTQTKLFANEQKTTKNNHLQNGSIGQQYFEERTSFQFPFFGNSAPVISSQNKNKQQPNLQQQQQLTQQQQQQHNSIEFQSLLVKRKHNHQHQQQQEHYQQQLPLPQFGGSNSLLDPRKIFQKSD